MPPSILDRRERRLSKWVTLVEKDVAFGAGADPATYHCLAQPDYVSIVARTAGGRIPLVRQFRPAVEDYTWELPAGLCESGEDPAETCRRELHEETGLRADTVVPVGVYFPDTGRLQNRAYVFFVEASEESEPFEPERGIEVQFVTLHELKERIRTGTFRHQLHIAALAAVEIAGISLIKQ